MTRDGVIKKIRAVIEQGGTQAAAAQTLGVSQQYLTDLLKGRRDPGEKILSKFGLRTRVVYEPIPSQELPAVPDFKKGTNNERCR